MCITTLPQYKPIVNIKYWNMKKLIFSIIAVATVFGSQAQLLWKVSGGDSKGDSYLFGTHHIAPASVLDTTTGFNDALNSVSTVYGELEMAEMTSPDMQQIVMKHSVAPADSTLSKLLTAERVDSVNSILAKYTGGMLTVSAVDMMKPTVLDTQLGMFQNMVAFPEFNGQQQLDMVIQSKALETGKTVKGLETMDQQLSMLMGGPLSEQAESLMKSVRNDEKSIEYAKLLAAAYLAGDLAKMQEMFNDPDVGMSEASAKRLLYDRNDNWVKQLREVLATDNVMVAVGAAHLIGERGLIEQLRNAGYDVTPVK